MMKPAIEKATPASWTTEVTAVMVWPGLLLSLAGTAPAAEATHPEDTEARRRAEEDAAINAAGILAQAQEANALDPVG